MTEEMQTEPVSDDKKKLLILFYFREMCQYWSFWVTWAKATWPELQILLDFTWAELSEVKIEFRIRKIEMTGGPKEKWRQSA